MRILIKDLQQHIDSEVTIKGWVHVARDQGKMAFFDFRDMSGKVQGVVFGKPEVLEVAKTLRPEFVVEVLGIVNKRPEKMVNDDIENGDIELEITGIKILNTAETQAIEVNENNSIEVGEDVRLRDRYVDLRTDRMQKNIRMRGQVAQLVRNEFYSQGFTEIETPIFTKSTPEGARDFVVPSRTNPGKFFALPQSPQQYKQLLMSSGMERYFQFARCMRDEDGRGDRQPEFTQMDFEISFTTEEEVMDINERLLIKVIEELYPEKKIQQIPFPKMSYADAMGKYDSDRPDIREDKNDPNLLAFLWVVDFPFFEKTTESDDPQAQGEWTFTHNPFSLCKSEHIENLMNKENISDIKAAQYDITLNGFEIGGGSIRAHDPKILRSILQILGHKDEKIDVNFGHMFRAFASGTPPHGGIAWGFDRLMMILQNEPNIREVIAFPKTRDGKDLLMDAPSEIENSQLRELSIKLDVEK